MENKQFFTGLEEVFGRFGGLFVTLVLFAVYGWAKGAVSLDWFAISGYLALFWLLYELFSFGFFKAFRFFSESSNTKESDKLEDELDVPNE